MHVVEEPLSLIQIHSIKELRTVNKSQIILNFP